MSAWVTESYPLSKPSSVALGCFDGVHLGHQAVLGQASALADKEGLSFCVFCFDAPPKNFFVPHSVPLLTTAEEKKRLLAQAGAEEVLCIPFDRELASLSPEDFFYKILKDRLHAKQVVCGYNFTFGAKARGNTDLLARLCSENDMALTVIPPVRYEGTPISSSIIRTHLEEGRTDEANRLLGHPYFLTAQVVLGKQLGRTLGFPTVNQYLPNQKATPRYGVYLSRVLLDNGASFFGITNVGMRPTVNSTRLCSETHLFDFDGDLYGRTLTVEFLEFLRPETRFPSIDALSEQVHRDMAEAKQRIEKYSTH